jgi:hypothetical protein
MSIQPVEESLAVEQSNIREAGLNAEQKKIMEEILISPTNALKDVDSFVEGVLAYQVNGDYKKRAWALRDGHDSDLARHLALNLGGREKNLLKAFDKVPPETVRYWFQQMGAVSWLNIQESF